jgi:hypothetical protein
VWIFATFGFLAPFGSQFTGFESTPVCSTYLVHVTDVLSNVSKMEESLRKLKKVSNPVFIYLTIAVLYCRMELVRCDSVLLLWSHRLNMELVYLGSCVQLYSLAETPQLPPPPAFGLIHEGAIGQPR